MSIQEALKLLRFELEMTQADFAKSLNKACVTVNRWENGNGFPSRANAKMILEVAKKHKASDECISYLNEVLIPESKRNLSAATLGFPDIERELLFQLTDDSDDSLYIIEEGTYKLLYANRTAEKNTAKYLANNQKIVQERRLNEQLDKRCFHYFMGKDKPCSFCPLSEIEDDTFKDVIVTVPEKKRKYKIHAKKTEVRGNNAYTIYLTDITDADAERYALYEMTNDIPSGVGIYSFYNNDEHIELVFMNQHLYKMFDEKRRAKLRQNGVSDLCLVHSDYKQKLLSVIKMAISKNSEAHIDMKMKLADGVYHSIHLSGKIINKNKDKITFYCLFSENSQIT